MAVKILLEILELDVWQMMVHDGPSCYPIRESYLAEAMTCRLLDILDSDFEEFKVIAPEDSGRRCWTIRWKRYGQSAQEISQRPHTVEAVRQQLPPDICEALDTLNAGRAYAEESNRLSTVVHQMAWAVLRDNDKAAEAALADYLQERLKQ